MSLVSVVIPTRNRANMLDRAVRSVLSQTHQHWELIVVDDGSTDHTDAVVAPYGDRIRHIHQKSQGCSRARNAGIQASQGVYVAFLDDDDLWYPRKLELQSAILDGRPDIDLVYGTVCWVVGGSRQLLSTDPPAPETLLERLVAEQWAIPAGASVVMVRRQTLERSGLFDPAVWPFDDWDLWTRIALLGGRFARVSEPVAEYRMHESNVVHNRDLMHASYIAVLEKILSAPECPGFLKARRSKYLSRRWIRIGNERYVHLELDQAWVAWRTAVGLDPAVLTPQLLFLMAKSLFGARMLGWARQTKRGLAGAKSA